MPTTPEISDQSNLNSIYSIIMRDAPTMPSLGKKVVFITF